MEKKMEFFSQKRRYVNIISYLRRDMEKKIELFSQKRRYGNIISHLTKDMEKTVETEIISKEYIKPSSPTPLHLKTYKLSLLDQCRRHMYLPKVLYYPVNLDINHTSQTDFHHTNSKRLELLKQSLSETLARFYPFAGKLNDNLSVDCNDEGIYFIEARAKIPLNEFLNQPNLSSIKTLIPTEVSVNDGSLAGIHVALIQVTRFSCGGLVICVCTSHLFGDGITCSTFIKNWAATACKNNTEVAICPNNDASILFPQNNDASLMTAAIPFVKTGRYITRRFVFDARAIAILKAKATSSRVQNPTRVEVVSAFLSKCIMAAFKAKYGSQKPTLLTHLVNLRRKTSPQLSEYSMGNIIWTANALCIDGEPELDGLVCQLKKAIMKIEGDFVKSLQGDGAFLNFCEAMKDEIGASAIAKNRIKLTSWCNFGYYDVDFGWGKPIWVSTVGLDGTLTKYSNIIIFMDTRLGDGIEAWVYLVEHEMNILENDKEILALATLDPSPLGQG